MQKINSIIFDLGAVILDIDYQLTIDAFKNLGIKNFDEAFTKFSQTKLFDKFDKGSISPEDFRNGIRNLIGFELTDKQIDDAWNAIIIGFNHKNILLLEKLINNYFICLLSNTNAIHTPVYNALLKPFGYEHISELFHKTYLSHEIGMRKPEPEIFKFVLDDNKLDATKTLYIDDSAHYLPVAQSFGINTIHFTNNMKFTELFDNKALLIEDYL